MTSTPRSLCAICQQPSQNVLCDYCRSQWKPETPWVQALIETERHWRLKDTCEHVHTPLHISAQGWLYDEPSHHAVSEVVLLRQECQSTAVENTWLMEDLKLSVSLAGFSEREKLTYALLEAGVSDPDAAELIGEIEHHTFNSNAYRVRRKWLLKKLRYLFDPIDVHQDEHP